MTKKRLKEHKIGNQQRKQHLLRINRKSILLGGLHITTIQDGRHGK